MQACLTLSNIVSRSNCAQAVRDNVLTFNGVNAYALAVAALCLAAYFLSKRI